MRAIPRPIVLAAIAAVTFAACSGDDDPAQAEQLRDFVDAQAEAQDALRLRVSELENQISADGEDETAKQLRELAKELESLQAGLDGLRGDLGGETDARSAGDAALRGDVDDLGGQIDALTTQIAKLRSDLDQLRQAYQQHCSSDSHPGGCG